MRKCTTDHGRCQVLTIGRVGGVGLAARGGEQRRNPIHSNDDLLRYVTRGGMARPANDGRYTQDAFQKLLLHTAKWPRLRKALTTVIAGEYDDGIVGKSRGLERLQHAANIAVEAFHHGRVGFLSSAVAVKEVANTPRFFLVVGPLPRPMWGGKMQAQQERHA